MTDPRAFERAVRTRILETLIPELSAFEENLPEKDPNIYRPMPLMEHTFEAIRHAFGWIRGFGAEEYRDPEARRGSTLWINTALLFHDLGEVAIIRGMHLRLWYGLAVEWSRNRERNASILKETYPFFGLDTPEARNYLGHLIHPEISALLAKDFLARLGWGPRDIAIVQFLVRNQSVLIEKATYGRVKDGRTLHEDFYADIESVELGTGIRKEDLLKMLQVLQIADANAVRPDMARIPRETLMRVWMAYDYMNLVLAVRSSPSRYRDFMRYREIFGRIRRGKPFGTPFGELFDLLIGRIEAEGGRLDEDERRMLEQHLEYFEKFRIIKEDHIHINDQVNQLLRLVESASGKALSAADMALLLKGYKVAYRSHDGDSRRQLKTVPVGDVRRKFIEHPIRVARIMVEVFGVTDALVLVTLLLHDVLEDTDTSMDDIRAAFRKDDVRGRILKALEILTKPEAEAGSRPQPLEETDYLRYVAGCLTAGDRILPDMETFEWLRTIVPLAKACDKIQNRRTLMGRKPKGRIEEICRNWNSLVMFMESSSLPGDHKLRILEEFNKSLLEIFSLADPGRRDNRERLLGRLEEFLGRTLYEKVTEAPGADRGRLEAFVGASRRAFEKIVEDPVRDIEVRLVLFERRTLPDFLGELGLDEGTKAEILDEFSLLLFDLSEVAWLKGKRQLLGFQQVVRSYRKKIGDGDWEPRIPGIVEDLVRYTQGDKNVLPPIIRSGGAAGLPLVGALRDAWRRRGRKRRERVAALLPRVAMLPLDRIYWLEGDGIRSVGREAVEDRIGGIDVSRQPDGRLVIRLLTPLIP
ncbi:MAG: hypothetical protein JXP48_13460 [Acidobacteria bacterium]|nr:hypothetical protein [Acidobacteriota bacterium]